MLQFKVDPELCIRCGECADDCPATIIAMDDLPKIVNEGGCYRCLHCYAVCPTGAISILGHVPDAESKSPDLPSPAQMTDLVKWRRSVRRFKDESLPSGLIDELLETTCHAPTGVNAQEVLFTVVKDKAFMEKLSKEIMHRLSKLKDEGAFPAGMVGDYLGWVVNAWKTESRDVILRGAPHLLLTSAPKDALCPVQDTHIALTTFELLAGSHGIGTLWDGLFMMSMAFIPELAKMLGIPEDHNVAYAMLFGKPAVAYHRPAKRGPAKVNVAG